MPPRPSRVPHLVWHRPRRCESVECVEVAFTDTEVLMRDSTRPDGPQLAFGRREWQVFLDAVRAGEFTA